jgi:hypothetical protein
MDGSDAHLVQSCKEVFGHIDRLFKAVQPVVGGAHSSISESRAIEENALGTLQ